MEIAKEVDQEEPLELMAQFEVEGIINETLEEVDPEAPKEMLNELQNKTNQSNSRNFRNNENRTVKYYNNRYIYKRKW